jgi:hypothetical protein
MGIVFCANNALGGERALAASIAVKVLSPLESGETSRRSSSWVAFISLRYRGRTSIVCLCEQQPSKWSLVS